MQHKCKVYVLYTVLGKCTSYNCALYWLRKAKQLISKAKERKNTNVNFMSQICKLCFCFVVEK
jgi:hypothetical protein